jgi:hypothetical protein
MSTRTKIVVLFIALATLARLAPHPANFSPLGAMALFGAAYFASLWTALLVPLTAMFLSDLVMYVMNSMGISWPWLGGRGIYPGMWIIYAAFVLITMLGLLLRKKKTVLAVGGIVLASSILFFVVTNFAWWAIGAWGYPMTLGGLELCFVNAIPFFHWTLLGDAFFALVLFGGFALVEKYYPALLAEVQPS